MKDYRFSLSQVLDMGYHEAHRLWLIADEIRFRDLQYQSLVMDFSNAEKEKRQEFLDWVHSRQPRGKQNGNVEIPEEVLERFAEAFNNGR